MATITPMKERAKVNDLSWDVMLRIVQVSVQSVNWIREPDSNQHSLRQRKMSYQLDDPCPIRFGYIVVGRRITSFIKWLGRQDSNLWYPD